MDLSLAVSSFFLASRLDLSVPGSRGLEILGSGYRTLQGGCSGEGSSQLREGSSCRTVKPIVSSMVSSLLVRAEEGFLQGGCCGRVLASRRKACWVPIAHQQMLLPGVTGGGGAPHSGDGFQGVRPLMQSDGLHVRDQP